MKHFTFIRHTQSLYNKDHVSGRDPELSDKGREMATQLEGSYEYALISNMKRARETFECAYNLTASVVEISSLCRENVSDIESKHGPSNMMKGEENNSEDDIDFDFRMSLLRKFLLYRASQYDTIVIVTHQGVIKAMTGEKLKNGECFSTNELLKKET